MVSVTAPPASRKLRGPAYRNPLGALPEYRRDPLSLFYGQAIAYGGSVRIRIAHEQIHLLVDPDHIRQVLTVNTDKYVKGISYASLSHLLGDGLLTSDGELWRRQRALIRPAFGRQHTVDEIPLIAECGNRLLDRLDAKAKSGEVFDLVPELMSFALDVVCRAAMGSDIDAPAAADRAGHTGGRALDHAPHGVRCAAAAVGSHPGEPALSAGAGADARGGRAA